MGEYLLGEGSPQRAQGVGDIELAAAATPSGPPNVHTRDGDTIDDPPSRMSHYRISAASAGFVLRSCNMRTLTLSAS